MSRESVRREEGEREEEGGGRGRKEVGRKKDREGEQEREGAI